MKGMRRIALARAEVLLPGLRHDRRFMVVDAAGTFVTQREEPLLALVETALEDDALVLSTTGGRARAPLTPEGPRRRVTVWKDEVDAIDVGGDVAALVSEHLGRSVSLVYMPHDSVRVVEPEYARPGDRVGFADAYPALLACLASLDDLNARLDVPVPMDRFRANIVVAGGDPFAEESAARARVGAVTFRTPKRCSRCVVTTVDQDTAAKGKEPLRTLAKYRSEANKVYFAMNAIPDAPGTIAVGDAVVFDA